MRKEPERTKPLEEMDIKTSCCKVSAECWHPYPAAPPDPSSCTSPEHTAVGSEHLLSATQPCQGKGRSECAITELYSALIWRGSTRSTEPNPHTAAPKPSAMAVPMVSLSSSPATQVCTTKASPAPEHRV